MLVYISIFLMLAISSLYIKAKYSKSKKEDEQVTQSFWERERAANSIRKKDISNLPYINVDLEHLPFKESTDNKLVRYQEAVKRLAGQKILNLSGMTNTDLKIQYGAPNLTALIACDTNFTELSKSLQQWGKYLYDSANMQDAKIVLEYAIACKTDIAATYSLLGTIYYNEQNQEGLKRLIESVKTINSPNKESAANTLKQFIMSK